VFSFVPAGGKYLVGRPCVMGAAKRLAPVLRDAGRGNHHNALIGSGYLPVGKTPLFVRMIIPMDFVPLVAS